MFTMPSATIPTPILTSRPRLSPRPAMRIPPVSRPLPRRKPELLSINMDEFGNMEMAKTRLIPENIWYQWYGWLINHVL